VSRIEITHEYVRAALDYHLSYMHLKQLARTGMEHNFLPGPSLWAAPDIFTSIVDGCHDQALGSDRPTVSCKTFLDGSQKATAQWSKERRFRIFETQFRLLLKGARLSQLNSTRTRPMPVALLTALHFVCDWHSESVFRSRREVGA